MPDPIATTVVTKVVENLVNRILDFILNPITARFTAIRKCNENVENLKSQVKKLEDEQERWEKFKKDVGREGKMIDDTVQTWLNKAYEFIEAAEEPVRVGDEFAKKQCFFRLCTNPIPRYKLSKEAEKNSQDIVKHLEGASRFGPLSLSHVPPPRQDVAALVEGFEEFPSRKEVLDQIMEALRSPTVNKVGVHGTSGVGKTMLVKMVKENAKQDRFSVVVMATVTKDRDLKSIQEDIARDLGMDQLPFREGTDRQVADRIKARLMKEKKFLVILDDVWETEIDFEKFGIPSASELKQTMEQTNKESSSGQEDMLCKVLITSRYRHVLFGMMGEKDQLFEVVKLEDDEAWHLFKKTVGSNLESSDFQPTAKEIVEKCLGLPVAIASVGKAMKGKTQEDQWRNALIELTEPTPEGISAGVYKPIELSYNYLQRDELKKAFMLCSLLGHDSSINDLLKYGMGLNLFQKVKKMGDTRAKALEMVRDLKDSSLLVKGHSNMHFGMHDQIRQIALSIAARDHGVLALVDEDVEKEWPEEETMEKLQWIYLSNGYPELTSNGLKCPRLTFFHLSNKGCSLAAPTDLFTGTQGLKVLCLTKIDFQSIPSQIPLIPTKLHTLLLDQCVFTVKELGSIVGNLENLQVLSLAGCDIEELPREIGTLSKLKLLDMSDCTKLKVVPPQLLARLSKLEELKMGNSFDRWDDVEAGNARLAELTELHELTALEVHISNFQETLFPENLERFKIFIGTVKMGELDWLRWYRWNSYSWESSFESSKTIKIKLQGASIKSNDSIKKLLMKTEELYLEGLNGVENFVNELDDEGFEHLKCLEVKNAPDIRHIFKPAAGRLVHSVVFPILEVLALRNLVKMEKICDGLTGAATFKKLRKITVVGCHQLKNLFSFSMARQLQRLQEIEVEDCKSIEQIIDDVEEQGNGNDIVEESEGCKLGNTLRSLKLRLLPKLDISLFNDKIVFPNLEKLDLSGIKINQLWTISSCVENLQEILNFKGLKHLHISICSSLEYLFTPSMVSGLGQLKDLNVSLCEDLKQVIMAEGVEEAVNTELIFPQLNSISLWACNKLSSFYAGSGSYALKFQSDIKISISYCPNMITFVSTFSTEKEKETAYQKTDQGHLQKNEPNICNQTLFDDMVVIPVLDDLSLQRNCVQQIWPNQITPMSSFVQKLRKLTLENCNNLKYLFTPLMVKIFEQLEVLRIRKCEEMQVVMLIEEPVENERTSQTMFPKPNFIERHDFAKSGNSDVKDGIMFSQLKFLELENLPNLSSYSRGKCDLEFPSLKEVIVTGCPQMKYFSMGKTVTKGLQNVQCTYHDKKGHWVGDLNSTIQDLFTLKVSYLESGNLWLSKFPELIEIWKMNPEKLLLLFQNLRHLKVCNCNNLSYLLTPTMKLAFVQLEGLEIKDSAAMEQVIMVTGVEEVVETGLTFPRLKSILLESCSKLSSFYVGSNALRFPLLEQITVKNCPKMVRFTSKFSSIQEKGTIDEKSEEMLVKEEPDILIGPFFCDEVEFLKLKLLKLTSINIHQIWPNEISKNSSSIQNLKELKELVVEGCGNLKYLFTSSMVESFEQLTKLQICDCMMMEIVILTEELGEEERMSKIFFPKLDYLKLQELSMLTRFCSGNFFDFSSLANLHISECPMLKTFISGSITGDTENGVNADAPYLFNEEIVFSNLEKLELSRIKINQLWTTSSRVENPQEILNFKGLKHLEIMGCSSLDYLFTPSMVSGLVQLKDLYVLLCNDLKQVIMAEGVEEAVNTELIFPQLNSISLQHCNKLSSFYAGSGSYALKFQSAIKIEIWKCPNMITFVSTFSTEKEKETAYQKTDQGYLQKNEPNICSQTLFDDMVVIPVLDDLSLWEIRVQKIWHNQITPMSSFIQKLRKLAVCDCNNLKYLFTSLMVKIFEQLEVLKIQGCEEMQEVILIEEPIEKERTSQTMFSKPESTERHDFAKSSNTDVKDGIMFSQLKSLELENLPKLSSYSTGKCDLEFPSLTEVIVIGCPQMKYFSMGKAVTKGLQNVQWTYHNKKGHWVGDLNSTIQDFFTQKVGCLEYGNLWLSNFPELIEIWKMNPEKLSLLSQNLQRLKVCNCNNLRYLLTPNMALAFVQLEDLEIKDCAAMEQVIMVTGFEEIVETGLTFPRLKSILLKSCSKLSSFYVGSNALRFPLLEKIRVKNCPKMVRFTSKFSSIQEKETTDGKSEEMLVKEEPDIFIGPFFCDMIKIPIWKTLTLSSINIRQIWNSQLLAISSFAQHLTKLKVVNCCNLKYLLTFSMVKSFAQLEELMISECEIMEVVILIEGMAEEERIHRSMFPQLKTLVLNDLPKLATFCSNCGSLGEISESERVNFGIGSQELLATQSSSKETKARKVVFSQVTWLALRLLPKFKYFFPQTRITEWPSLERLVVMDCHEVQIVASEFSSVEMTHGDNQLERESQPLTFWISKATFPSLKHLAVKWNDNLKIWCGHHPEEYFGLEVLTLIGFPKQSAFPPPFFCESLPNLKELVVKDAFLSEIFQCEEVTAKEKPVYGHTSLSKLTLSKLHELTHLWKEESQIEADILNNLKSLKVQECGRLKNLVPSTVHFDNLRTLLVSECHGLVNLMRYSTAKSLGQLKIMKVANCEMIKEIFICLGDAVKDDGIVFTNLECLQLEGLPRLESFCLGNCNFKFVALHWAIVTGCPNMQIFSEGELCTPRLHEVKLTGVEYKYLYRVMDEDVDEDIEKEIDDMFYEDEGVRDKDDEVKDKSCWEDNLNSTIQHLFKEKRARNSKKSNRENSDCDAKEDEFLNKIWKTAFGIYFDNDIVNSVEDG